jgi:hypothetical protein
VGLGVHRPRAGRQTDRSGPVPGALATDRWVRTQESDGGDQHREGLTAVGGAAPSHGGEVAGVGAGASYGGSWVTGASQKTMEKAW